MIRIATKSKNEMTNMPIVSRANDTRYCICARMRATINRPYSARPSATLHDEPARSSREQAAGRHEQDGRPRHLHGQDDDDFRTSRSPDEDVDRQLDHRREWSGVRDRAQPIGKE